MKNIILIFIASLFVLASCEKNERMLYDETQSVYFKSHTDKADSLTTSLVTKPVGPDTIYIKVQLLGRYLEQPQKFKLEVISDKTTAVEGKHFASLEEYYEFPVNVPEFDLPIVLIKGDEMLQMQALTLAVRLKEDELKLGFQDRQYVRIVFSDMFVVPESESGSYSNMQQFIILFGAYSQVKHRMIFEYLGEDLPTAQYGMYYKNYDDEWVAASKYLSDYCRDNEVIDENGKKIFPWR